MTKVIQKHLSRRRNAHDMLERVTREKEHVPRHILLEINTSSINCEITLKMDEWESDNVGDSLGSSQTAGGS